MNHNLKSYLGELVGTFVLTFIGCSSVAITVLYDAFQNIVPVALIWGVGVTLAIYLSKSYSKSHLNPAVSFGYFILKKIKFSEFITNSFFQLIGGILAGLLVYSIFISDIIEYEKVNNLISIKANWTITASIFGEFFPNPGYRNEIGQLSTLTACCYEGIGTFVLMLVILSITSNRLTKSFAPILIGLLVALLIIWIAPFTQCGINPARDFGPRLVAFFSHWGKIAFPEPEFSFLTVYIVSPILGAGLASLIWTKFNKS